ncbi:hypothetical protein CI102_11358 [Trichoderma harzianum]|uniref:Uncharacterized protein n=1 Tax=Trichoderma harzianum CBS 226.95 TaxID=983964 RepID=A0A2T4AIX7_TRIHA|nr:hypothetical protein M431DRAFT_392566 [Trichoderma harzianum CBS 226.95]PKK44567.1 hypothetical protein CI102_11358 [Trichoderma harzianum]PTB57021.1 hypothetical protein M431DRAFT_392566 [Trichoderma harzianum CBS 226.95]
MLNTYLSVLSVVLDLVSPLVVWTMMAVSFLSHCRRGRSPVSLFIIARSNCKCRTASEIIINPLLADSSPCRDMPLSLPCPLPKKEQPEINQRSINARKSASGQSVPAHAPPKETNQTSADRVPISALLSLFPSPVEFVLGSAVRPSLSTIISLLSLITRNAVFPSHLDKYVLLLRIRFIATCHYHLFLTLIPPFFRHMQRPSRSNMINHYSSADNHATAGSTHTSRTSRANKFPADGRKAYSPPPSLPPPIQTPSAHPLVLNFSLAHPFPQYHPLAFFFPPRLLHPFDICNFFPFSLCLSVCRSL